MEIPKNKDNKEAVLRSAALRGDPKDMIKFGIYWEEECNDFKEAMEWYEKAAKLNNKEAKIKLREAMLKYGIYLEEECDDFYEAMEWYKKAADLNNKEAMIKIAEKSLESLDILNCEKNLAAGRDSSVKTVEELTSRIKNARDLGIEYCEKALCFGANEAEIYFLMANICDEYSESDSKAFEYYLSSLKAGNISAALKIGNAYAEGLYKQPEDQHKAIKYYLRYIKSCPESNIDDDVYEKLSRFYSNTKNAKQAAYWMYRASNMPKIREMAEKGNKYAQKLLAKAAKEGNIKAMKYVEEGYAAGFENESLENLSKEFPSEKKKEQNGQTFMDWLRSLFGKK